MPKHLAARRPLDAHEERQVRKLTHSVHAPADWSFHAKIVARSWDGLRTRQIAEELGCHSETVRHRLHAFKEQGLDGLGMLPGSGRKPRLTPLECSTILALVKLTPPGKPTYELTGELEAPDPEGTSEWTLDTLAAAARERGIQVARDPAARCGASSCRKGYAGAGPACGRAVKILTSPHKGADRRARHRPTRRSDGRLRRRTRPRNPAQFPARSWLVADGPPHQSAPGL
jgi:transposase